MEYENMVDRFGNNLPFQLYVLDLKEELLLQTDICKKSIWVVALLEGEGIVSINQKPIYLRRGEFLLFKEGRLEASEGIEKIAYFLEIPCHILGKEIWENRMFYQNKVLQDLQIIELLRELVHLSKKESILEFKKLSKFYELLDILVERYSVLLEHSKFSKEERKINRFSQIVSYIEHNYRKDISLGNLALQFGYSTSYLSRIFQKYTKKNYKEYLNLVRLEQGIKELAKGTKTIGEIAIDLGFPNNKSFSNSFRKEFGILPSQYRKNIKDKE